MDGTLPREVVIESVKPLEADSERGAPKTRVGRLIARGAHLALAFSIVACASQDSVTTKGYDDDRAERIFSVGYDDIAGIYIDDVRISELAVAGIDGLGSLDPAFSVGREGDQLNLYIDNVRTETLNLPRNEDADAWGELTARAINASVGRGSLRSPSRYPFAFINPTTGP